MDDAEFKDFMKEVGFMETQCTTPDERATDFLARFTTACFQEDLDQQREVYNDIIDGTMTDMATAHSTAELFVTSTLNKARIVAAVVIKYSLVQTPNREGWERYGDTLTLLVDDDDPNVALKAAEARQTWRRAALVAATDPDERAFILQVGTSRTPESLQGWV